MKVKIEQTLTNCPEMRQGNTNPLPTENVLQELHILGYNIRCEFPSFLLLLFLKWQISLPD